MSKLIGKDQEIEKNKANNLLRHLLKNERSIFYAIDSINQNVINKAKKSNYLKDKVFVSIYSKLKDKKLNVYEKPVITPFVEEKNNIDRILYIVLRHLLNYFMLMLLI